MKILFVGGEKDGEYLDVELDDDGFPYYHWEVMVKDGHLKYKTVLYKLKAILHSTGELKNWEYHLL